MIDPISLSTSILTLIEGASVVSKQIRRVLNLRGAPKRLLDLHNQIETLRVFLKALQRTTESCPATITDENEVFRFTSLINRAKETIDSASDFVRFKLIRNPQSLENDSLEIQVRKVKFFKEEKRLEKLTAELCDILQLLQTAASTQSLVLLQFTLSNVQLCSKQRPLVYENAIEISPGIVQIADNLESTPETEDGSGSITLRGNSTSNTNQEMGLSSDVDGFVSSSQQLAPQANALPPSLSVRAEVSSVQADLSNICGCRCHAPLAVKTPNYLGYAVGTLLVRWHCTQQTCTKCSHSSCRSMKKNALQLQYYFPWWLLQSLIEVESAWNSSRKISISLRTTRIVPNDSKIFAFTQHNNLDGIKRLFKQGKASPFDVSPTGRTPLHYAATAVKADMIAFLVQQKADGEVEDHNNLSPNDIIWELYLRNPEKRRYLLTAAGLSLEDTNSLERQCFTGIQRIALGLEHSVDLDSYLKIDSADIDKQDRTGKTAIAWASSRKDAITVRTLLKYKASVQIADHRQKTPLHYAAGSGLPEAVEMILEAIQHLENTHKRSRKSASLIEAFDDEGRTPLNYATRRDLLTQTRLLIKYGANLEATETHTGRSILLNAIYRNSHQVLPALLSHGARTDARDTSGATTLHHIARFGDLQTLNIMADHDLGYIDTTVTDSSGLTALEIFESANARCSPENEQDRQLAKEMFAKILKNATFGGVYQTRMIEESQRGVENQNQNLESEPNKLETSAIIATKVYEDDPDETFYDAVSEILELQNSYVSY